MHAGGLVGKGSGCDGGAACCGLTGAGLQSNEPYVTVRKRPSAEGPFRGSTAQRPECSQGKKRFLGKF